MSHILKPESLSEPARNGECFKKCSKPALKSAKIYMSLIQNSLSIYYPVKCAP